MEIIPEDELRALGPVVEQGTTILELGNKKNSRGLYRTWYEQHGAAYTCLDWNGMDGALKLDMRKRQRLGPFDVVTNFGFTEHVTDQFMCWWNVHEFVKVGGRLVICMPNPGQFNQKPNWELHGYWQPTLEWYQQFVERNGYEAELLEINKRRVRWTVVGRLRKVEERSLLMPDESLMHRTRA